MTSSSNFYSIDKYADVLFSYFGKIVPLSDYRENIKFRNKVLLHSPELHGVFKKLAAFMVTDVNYEGLEEKKAQIFKKQVSKILASSKWSNKQFEILYNLFFYDEIVAMVFPKTTYRIDCDVCGVEQAINEHYDKDITIQRDKKREGKVKFKTFCPKCNKETSQEVDEVVYSKDFVSNPFNIIVFNPFDVIISRGYGNTERVYFSPNNYKERVKYNGIREGAAIGAEQIVNFPLKFIEAIVLNQPLRLNPKLTTVFKHPIIKGLDRGLSPLLLSLSTLLHTNILRRGRESNAFQNINPTYILTPPQGQNAPQAGIMDGRNQTDFIMKSVKAVKEGDSNGLIYSSSPVQAVPIFGDQKRWITSNELLAEEATMVNSTGFDMSVLQGGSGLVNDPFILHTVKEVIGFYIDQTEDFLNKMITTLSVYDSKFEYSGRVELNDITKSDGTQLDNVSLQFIQEGKLPLSTLYRKLGFNNMEEVLTQVKDEKIALFKHELNIQTETARIEKARTPMMMAEGNVDPGVMKNLEANIEQQAEELAQQLYHMEDGAKRSEMDKIQKQSYTLWAVVSSKLRDINQSLAQEAKTLVKEQGGQ